MSPRGHHYTLVGFSEELDRRPLHFVEPLPAAKICSACGFVSKVVGLLPCGHFLCKPCHQQCERGEKVVCPLEGDACSGEEVTWVDHPSRSIFEKQVSCWNHTNGCNIITSAADISKHFLHECEHHMARCPKCSAKILASDVCSHLESHCNSPKIPSEATFQARQTVCEEQQHHSMTCSDVTKRNRQMPNSDSMGMSSIQAQLKEISRAFKIVAGNTLCDYAPEDERHSRRSLLQDTVSRIQNQRAEKTGQNEDFGTKGNVNQQAVNHSFSEKIEALEQTVNQAMQTRLHQKDLAVQFSEFRKLIGEGFRDTKAELEGISLGIDSNSDRMTDLFQNTFASLLSCTPFATSYTWTFEEYASLLQRLQKEKYIVKQMLEPVYLRGYCVSAGISIDKDIGIIYFCFELHKGKLDEFLQWPFNLRMKFRLLHPESSEKLEHSIRPDMFNRKHFLRPVNVANGDIPIFGKYFTPAELEGQGFIKDGRMLLSLELEPVFDAAE